MDSFQTTLLIIGAVSFILVHGIAWWVFRRVVRRGEARDQQGEQSRDAGNSDG